MTSVFIVEDEFHAEQMGEYLTFEEALAELKRLMQIPWDKEPNICPCTSWRTCGRNYYIIEYEISSVPWKELNSQAVLDISSEGVIWRLNQKS